MTSDFDRSIRTKSEPSTELFDVTSTLSNRLSSTHCRMSSLRIARVAARVRPAALRIPIQRRGYADAVADKIKLSLSLPHQVRNRQNEYHNPFNFSPCIFSLNILTIALIEYLQIHRCVRNPFLQFPFEAKSSKILVLTSRESPNV